MLARIYCSEVWKLVDYWAQVGLPLTPSNKYIFHSYIMIFFFQILKMGQGAGSGEGGPKFVWGILWFLTIWFIAWPVAFFLAWLYIFLLPFSVCIDPLKAVCQFLQKCVQLPLTCAENMVSMKPMCWYVFFVIPFFKNIIIFLSVFIYYSWAFMKFYTSIFSKLKDFSARTEINLMKT